MRWLMCCLLLGALGCAGRKEARTAGPKPANSPRAQPAFRGAALLPPAGKVFSVNSQLRFVVLNFSVGGMPAIDQRLNVYRGAQKVAELKVSGPQRGDSIIADITAGSVQAGDEARPD
jgi:hypothetical protein